MTFFQYGLYQYDTFSNMITRTKIVFLLEHDMLATPNEWIRTSFKNRRIKFIRVSEIYQKFQNFKLLALGSNLDAQTFANTLWKKTVQ